MIPASMVLTSIACIASLAGEGAACAAAAAELGAS